MWYYDYRMGFFHIIWEYEMSMSQLWMTLVFFMEKNISRNILDELIAFQILNYFKI